MLLLLLNDESGRAPFLEALSGPDGDVRNLAIEFVQYCVYPHDTEIRGGAVTTCPITSDELFAALKRNLHEPWTGLNRRVLEIVSRHGYPQARSVTRPLLTHPDASLRREIAENYLRAGRDEGAFALVEELLLSAPVHVPARRPSLARLLSGERALVFFGKSGRIRRCNIEKQGGFARNGARGPGSGRAPTSRNALIVTTD